MASWGQGMVWTTKLASRLANVLDQGGGHCESVKKFRDAIRADSPILAQRAEAAYDEAHELIRGTATDEEFRRFLSAVGEILSEAMGNVHDGSDWIQEAVITRAAELEKTAYRIAQDCDQLVSEDHIHKYLNRKSSMGSHKLQHVLRALGLQISPAK